MKGHDRGKEMNDKRVRRKKSRLIVMLISISTFFLGVLCTFLVTNSNICCKVYRISEDVVTFTSFLIAFVALVFAMITYFSIDAVNAITSMDGNVLENENYSIAYHEMVEKFAKCESQEAFSRTLFEICTPRKRVKTCMDFADDIQRIVDYLIWFAYVDFEQKQEEKSCEKKKPEKRWEIVAQEKLLKTIKHKKDKYDKLSNGINYLLDENIKLIETVFAYQRKRNQGEEFFVSELEDVRGEMLKNPISRIVYYDYLGLYYRRRAGAVLNECGEGSEEFSAKHMQAIFDYKYSEEQLFRYRCLINRAHYCFDQAQKLSNKNVLWDGYIKYNSVRIDVMEYLVRRSPSFQEVVKKIDEVICAREEVLFLFRGENAYLNIEFEKEVERARQLRNNFMKI